MDNKKENSENELNENEEEIQLQNSIIKEVKEPKKGIIKDELKQANLKILELMAEKENLTKNLEHEKKEFIKYRSASFLSGIIPTFEMMEQSLKAKNVSDEVKNWLKGFEMIYNNLKTEIENEGVKIHDVEIGQYYDSYLHHVIEEQESIKFKPGQVIKSYNKVYKLHDRLLRPANVIVAKAITAKEIGIKGE